MYKIKNQRYNGLFYDFIAVYKLTCVPTSHYVLTKKTPCTNSITAVSKHEQSGFAYFVPAYTDDGGKRRHLRFLVRRVGHMGSVTSINLYIK